MPEYSFKYDITLYLSPNPIILYEARTLNEFFAELKGENGNRNSRMLLQICYKSPPLMPHPHNSSYWSNSMHSFFSPRSKSFIPLTK